MDRKMNKIARPPARFKRSRYERIRLIVDRNIMRVLNEMRRTAGASPEVHRIRVGSPVPVRVPVDRF